MPRYCRRASISRLLSLSAWPRVRRESNYCRPQLQVLEDRQLPSTFLVTATADAGAGSLRQAILDANANPGLDTIAFAIGGSVQTIAPLSALPTIIDPVILDGTTQPGFAGRPVIELRGDQAGAANGLHLTAGNSTVRGLVVNRFGLRGILIEGTGGNVIAGNYLGTDVTGTQARGNLSGGIRLASNSNHVGGTRPADRNIISGNRASGIIISNVSGNMVQGNYIGSDATGTVPLGNFEGNAVGVSVSGSNNTIGGLAKGAGNLIADNYSDLRLSGSAHVVQGNYIGTDVTGTRSLSNRVGDISVSGSGHLVGGTMLGARNLIGFIDMGIAINVTIQGNHICVDATGSRALGGYGVRIEGSNNLIGGRTREARNIISGCDTQFAGGPAVEILGTATNNRIQGNFIGTDVTGTVAIPNGRDGIAIGSSFGGPSNNIIGGTEPGAGNLISGNEENGIAIYGSYNIVQGNKIGTDVTGTRALPNGDFGIRIGHFQASGVVGNVIGGIERGAGNLISGNRLSGIWVDGSSPGTGGHRIQGNFIGTDITGTKAVPNSNSTVSFAGVSLGGTNNLVGGTEPGAGNLISGNARGGLAVGASGTRVEGNWIGTDRTGTRPLGNMDEGVRVGGQGVSNVTIGGTVPGAGNVIAFNGRDGVVVNYGLRNPIRGNAIWGHGATYRGIRLINGANNNQAAPQLSWADVHGNRLTVAGTLTSAPNTTYTLEFFANPVCHPSGYGEGKQPLGTIQVATNGEGSAEFEALLHGWLTHPLALGRYITATATDPAGNTSEFSRCALNTGVLSPWIPVGRDVPGLLLPRHSGQCSSSARLGNHRFEKRWEAEHKMVEEVRTGTGPVGQTPIDLARAFTEPGGDTESPLDAGAIQGSVVRRIIGNGLKLTGGPVFDARER